MSEYSEEHIKNILNQYQRKREKEKERYERIKDTEEFKTQNRERARNHYHINKVLRLHILTDHLIE